MGRFSGGTGLTDGTLERELDALAGGAVRTVSEDAVLTSADKIVLVNNPAGPVVLTVPDPALGYAPILIKKIDSGVHAVSLAAHDGENIEGAAGPHVLESSDTADMRAWTLLNGGAVHWVA